MAKINLLIFTDAETLIMQNVHFIHPCDTLFREFLLQNQIDRPKIILSHRSL